VKSKAGADERVRAGGYHQDAAVSGGVAARLDCGAGDRDAEPERHDGALRPGFLTERHDVGAGPAT